MKTSKFKEKISAISEGVLSNTIDFLLFCLYFGFELTSARRTAAGVDWAANQAFEKVCGGEEETSFKRSLYNARAKGWAKRKEKFWQITKEGRERLSSIIPIYKEKRSWDERLYLVAYDIPETRKRDRDLIRYYLKKIGCGMLQRSVWLTPFNPKGILHQFIKGRKLRGAVIISDLGEDGSIGEESLEELVIRVYNLKRINNRYQKFINQAEKKELDAIQMNFSFLAILKDDPQLPFELLPKWWLGEKAHQIFKKIVL